MAESVEVEAPAAAMCWKCRGGGTGAASGQTQARARQELSTCTPCGGTGRISRKAARVTRRKEKVFAGWPVDGIGPVPAHSSSSSAFRTHEPALPPAPLLGTEEWCYFTGAWRILQTTDSHRYSTDDVVTAWVAWRAGRALSLPLEPHTTPACASAPAPASASPSASAPASAPASPAEMVESDCGSGGYICDIGCGLGSVLLMNAWLHPQAAAVVGVEAQARRQQLAERSIAYNIGLQQGRQGQGRVVAAVRGDLRDLQTQREMAQLALSSASASAAAAGTDMDMDADKATSTSINTNTNTSTNIFCLVTGTPPYFDVGLEGEGVEGATPPCEESARYAHARAVHAAYAA